MSCPLTSSRRWLKELRDHADHRYIAPTAFTHHTSTTQRDELQLFLCCVLCATCGSVSHLFAASSSCLSATRLFPHSHILKSHSHVLPHTSHLTPHTSPATRHTSHVTRHTPHVTRHTSHVLSERLETPPRRSNRRGGPHPYPPQTPKPFRFFSYNPVLFFTDC